MADLSTIQRFLATDVIGVVGVRRDPKQFANGVYRRLRDTGRTLVPVHPEADAIEGDACVPTVDQLPGEARALLVMVNAERSGDVVRRFVDDRIGRGIEPGTLTVWLHRGAGAGAVSDEAVQACRDAGVPVVDGACPLMFLEPVRGIHRLHRFMIRRRLTGAT